MGQPFGSIAFKMTGRQRLDLHGYRLYHKLSKFERRRFRAVLSHANGCRAADIARREGVCIETVYRWVAAYVESGYDPKSLLTESRKGIPKRKRTLCSVVPNVEGRNLYGGRVWRDRPALHAEPPVEYAKQEPIGVRDDSEHQRRIAAHRERVEREQ